MNNQVKWNEIDWRKVEKSVFKLQKRIYQAYENGDVKKGRRLQKTLIKSYNSRLLAVRKVSQDNRGKATAGVDKVKSLTPKHRLAMAEHLKLSNKAKPIRRVWIPKPGKKEKRPLGIPVMRDRAVQALVKAAEEPRWEWTFEPNSYGFRPGRGTHDAVEAIFNQIRYKPKYVLDADISKCFDKINHEKLLTKMNTSPKIRRQVKAWLKSDVCDFVKHEKTPTEAGTPQGGVISPLLANIALHGMEERIEEYAASWKGQKTNNKKSLSLIRYADDFVIIHERLEIVERCKQIISEWLAEYDLEIKPEKTQIVHTLKQHNGKKPGFNFLGFNIRQYPVGKYKSGKKPNGEKIGCKTVIKPSADGTKRHYERISDVIKRHEAAPQTALVVRLNAILKGWSNYYRTVCSKETYSKLSHLITTRLLRWAKKRHPNKSMEWIVKKYWKTVGGDNWVFGNKDVSLYSHPSTPIVRHTKVKGVSSPYDGNTKYWASRMGRHPELSDSIARLLKKQKGKCNICDLTFREDDVIEKDHIIPKALGGEHKDNIQLLHGHCHDEKTKDDLIAIKKHKAIKNYQKFIKQFSKSNWKWIDDIPTLVSTHKEPEKRGAV